MALWYQSSTVRGEGESASLAGLRLTGPGTRTEGLGLVAREPGNRSRLDLDKGPHR